MSLHTKGPTLEEMATAWKRRKRRNWPESFQEAMEHPLYSRILMIEAIRLALNGMHRWGQTAPLSDEASTTLTRGGRVGFWMDTDDKGLDSEPGPL